eukprot:3895049-Pyramimonas_sp.AAC.1
MIDTTAWQASPPTLMSCTSLSRLQELKEAWKPRVWLIKISSWRICLGESFHTNSNEQESNGPRSAGVCQLRLH